jgi:hypothetical protein
VGGRWECATRLVGARRLRPVASAVRGEHNPIRELEVPGAGALAPAVLRALPLLKAEVQATLPFQVSLLVIFCSGFAVFSSELCILVRKCSNRSMVKYMFFVVICSD